MKERKAQIKKNKTVVYDMARECASYMKNNDNLYNDMKECIRDTHCKMANFSYVVNSLRELENCDKRVLP